jgi:hypothetical protein
LAGWSLVGIAFFAWHDESHSGLIMGGGNGLALRAKLGPPAAASIRPPAVAARTNLTVLLVGIETLLGIFADGGFENNRRTRRSFI